MHIEACTCTQIYDNVGNVIICSKPAADHILRQCREHDICSVWDWNAWQESLDEDDPEFLLDDVTLCQPWN